MQVKQLATEAINYMRSFLSIRITPIQARSQTEIFWGASAKRGEVGDVILPMFGIVWL